MKTDNPDIHRLDERTRGISASMDVLFGAAEKDRDSIRKRIGILERENEELRTELKLFKLKFKSGTAVKVAVISAAASVLSAGVGIALHLLGG